MIEAMPHDYILVSTIDYKNDYLDSVMKPIKKEWGATMVHKAKTIFYIGNSIVSHLDLHSTKQLDLKNIKRVGIVNSILINPI